MSQNARPGWRKLALAGSTLFCSVAALSPTMAAAQASSGTSARQLEEVIITAQRREESMQRSSLSVQVLSPDALASGAVVSPKDLTAVAPGVQVSMGGGYTQVHIRGIGDFAANLQVEPSVAFNIDEVVVGSNSGLGTEFYDLERVEILKGPQGTLYGRNAAGGAVNVVTRKPTEGYSGNLNVGAGNYNLIHVDGAFNAGGPTLAMRASFQRTKRDGYLTDGTDDEDSISGRVHGLWTPNDRLSLLVTLSGTHQKGKGTGASFLPTLNGNPWLGPSDPAVNAYLAARPLFGIIPLPTLRDDSFLNNKLWNLSANLKADLGFAKLTVIPAYRHGDIRILTNGFGYPAFDHTKARQKSLEVRLSKETERLKWVVGAYGYDQGQRGQNLIDQGVFQQADLRVDVLDTKSESVFGEATFGVTDHLRLIGGARYTHEKRNVKGQTTVTGPLLVGGMIVAPLDARHSDSAVTWKLGAEYDLAEESMAYATVSTGFKAGGINLISPGLNATYEPEKLTAYTVGVRNRFLDRRLQLNVEGFYWKYKDKQEALFGFDSSGLLQPFLQNAGVATIYGVSVDLVARVGEGGTLRGAVEYVHSKYDSFSYPSALGLPPDPSTTGCRPGAAVGIVDCSGFALSRSPKWSGTVGYEHRIALPNGDELIPHADVAFVSSRWLTPDFLLPNGRTGGYALVNADLTYARKDAGWSVTAWIHNIGKKATYNGAFQSIASGNFFANIGAPRTYGVRMSAEF